MRRRNLPLTAILALLPACAGDPAVPSSEAEPPQAALTLDERLDPASCAGCHPSQYREWSTSMHAYAADDPLFLAMNARAQRDTGGRASGFCVGCHAPLALRLQATDNGLDLASVPAKLRGVTCFFCHSVGAVTRSHNDALALAPDDALRGEIDAPLASDRHASRYSPLHDRTRLESAALCGACHDVQTPRGVDVETTFAEWSTTPFAQDPDLQRTCGNCHMAETTGPAANVPGAPLRRIHDHAMVGMDAPLVPWPGADTAPQTVQSRLDPALDARLCVREPGSVDITLTNARIGHAWPTGAAHDRRAWLEVVAYTNGSVVYQSGVVPVGTDVGAAADPPALVLREQLFDARGAAVPFMWEADATRSLVLEPTTAGGAEHPILRHFDLPSSSDRITMRVRATPIALHVVDALVASGDIDPSVRRAIPVYTLASTALEWTADRGWACLP